MKSKASRSNLPKESSLFKEETAAGDFGAVYMILVFAIVALLLVLIVKPMFQSAQKSIPKTS